MNSQPCFDNLPPYRDDMGHSLKADWIRDFAVGVAGVQKGYVVTHIGAPSAGLTRRLRRAGARVIEVDSFGQAPDRRTHRIGKNILALSRVALTKRLPIEDYGVDVVLAEMVLHHLQVPSLGILEMKRILKSGGRLVLTDLNKHDHSVFKEIYHDRWLGFYPGDIRHWLKIAGFSNIIVTVAPEKMHRPSPKYADPNAKLSIFMATATA